MRLIPLSKGQWALVDDEDYEWLSQWKWKANRVRKTDKYYAARNTQKKVNGITVYTCVLMHRLILGLGPGEQGDHEDRNSLNNQRYNLRVCTPLQNARNKGLRPDNTSGFKGVYLVPHLKSKPWRVEVKLDNKKKYRSYYPTAYEAALAYDRVAKEAHGEFALLNFPDTVDIQAVAA